MSNYPSWNPDADKVSHLLFDIGFSHGLLDKTQHILVELLHSQVVAMPHSLHVEIINLVDDLIGFKAGRLGDINEIYAAVGPAQKKEAVTK